MEQSSEKKLKESREYAKLLEQSIKIILDKLSGRVQKISVFGSYARGRRDLFTDLDILIIMKSQKPFLERTKDIYGLLSLPVDADILCYTPEEMEKMKKRAFMKNILKQEVVLYEKRSGTGGEKVARSGD